MKYIPSLPKKNDNISHNHPFGEFALLFTGLVLVFLFIFWTLGLFVDLAADRISYQTEVTLFKSVSSHLNFQLESASKEHERVQYLVDTLQNCTQLPYEIQVHMVQSEEPNAIALPGGNIAVFTGLLKKIDTENGLAFVLAHELAHFENRDHLRSLGRSVVFIALISIITGGDSSLSSLFLPSSSFSQAQYSQTRESLADKIALDTLFCHYGHVDGATDFFSSLLDTKLRPDTEIFHYFSSHPKLQTRISDLKKYALTQNYSFLSNK